MEMDSRKLFVGGISWDTTEERLRDYFQTFGEVVEAVIMKDRTTGRARGFGFIVFANASVAEKVVKERHIIDGRAVEAKKAVPRDDHQNFNRNSTGSIQGSPSPARTKKIFVGGLASTITEGDFKRYFDQFGTITDVVVMYDHNTQRPRGFGFITYDSEEAVDKVLTKIFHELNGKMVEVKRAVPKELSPGPTRSQPGGYNYGLNRLNSFLSAYTQGYNSSSSGGYGMRMDERHSLVPIGRSGYPPYSPSKYSMGLNLDSGFNLNYGTIGDSGFGYGRGMSSHYTGNSNRYDSPSRYDVGNNGSGSLFKTTNQNVWSNSVSYSTNSVTPHVFGVSGSGNAGIGGSFGNIGETWDSSSVSAQGVGSGSFNNVTTDYGSGENNFRGRTNYVRNNGGTVGSTPSYFATRNFHEAGFEAGFEKLYEGNSFNGDQGHAWHFSADLEASASFGYERGNAAANVTPNNSVGYVGDYNVATRSNRGIAA